MEYSVKETASVKRLMLVLYVMAISVVFLLIGTISVYAADDEDKPITVTISEPEEEWRNEAYDVEISIDTSNAPDDFEIKSVTARFGEGGTAKTITDNLVFTVKSNGTLYITVKDADGNSYYEQFQITYFDLEGPELIGAINEGVLTIQVADDKSGINSLIINGYEYTDCPNGTLAIRLQQFDASYRQFSIFVTDKLGNYSEEYIIDNPYYQEDADDSGNEDNPAIYLPINAEGSPITSATGTVTYHATEYGYTEGAGDVLDVSGNKVPDYDGMEFYIVQTPSGKTFYMVIDKASSDNNAYLLTEANEADLLNFTGTDKLVLPQNGAVIAGTYQGSGEEGEETVAKGGSFNASPTAIGNEESADGEDASQKAAKPKNNNMVMIIILVAIGGAAVLFMKMKGKKKKASEANADAPIPDDEDDDEKEEAD